MNPWKKHIDLLQSKLGEVTNQSILHELHASELEQLYNNATDEHRRDVRQLNRIIDSLKKEVRNLKGTIEMVNEKQKQNIFTPQNSLTITIPKEQLNRQLKSQLQHLAFSDSDSDSDISSISDEDEQELPEPEYEQEEEQELDQEVSRLYDEDSVSSCSSCSCSCSCSCSSCEN